MGYLQDDFHPMFMYCVGHPFQARDMAIIIDGGLTKESRPCPVDVGKTGNNKTRFTLRQPGIQLNGIVCNLSPLTGAAIMGCRPNEPVFQPHAMDFYRLKKN
jgi:hypothetical protein